MIINGVHLVLEEPIKNMITNKQKAHGVSHGLSEVGYDLRVKQKIEFYPPNPLEVIYYQQQMKEALIHRSYIEDQIRRYFFGYTRVYSTDDDSLFTETYGRTALASSVEEFQIPRNMWGELRNKSTHARRFIDATIGTDMEPGWKGFLTIELIFHGNEPIVIPAGSGIAKAVFHELKNYAEYDGKYQNQEDKPISPILE